MKDKKIISLMLCILVMISCIVGCGASTSNDVSQVDGSVSQTSLNEENMTTIFNCAKSTLEDMQNNGVSFDSVYQMCSNDKYNIIFNEQFQYDNYNSFASNFNNELENNGFNTDNCFWKVFFNKDSIHGIFYSIDINAIDTNNVMEIYFDDDTQDYTYEQPSQEDIEDIKNLDWEELMSQSYQSTLNRYMENLYNSFRATKFDLESCGIDFTNILSMSSNNSLNLSIDNTQCPYDKFVESASEQLEQYGYFLPTDWLVSFYDGNVDEISITYNVPSGVCVRTSDGEVNIYESVTFDIGSQAYYETIQSHVNEQEEANKQLAIDILNKTKITGVNKTIGQMINRIFVDPTITVELDTSIEQSYNSVYLVTVSGDHYIEPGSSFVYGGTIVYRVNIETESCWVFEDNDSVDTFIQYFAYNT